MTAASIQAGLFHRDPLYIAAMHEFDITVEDKVALYRDLASALDALTADEPDPIANTANAAALIWQYLSDLNWAGFYRAIGSELVLGPFQGKPACIRIPFGQGVCGTAAATGAIQRVDNVQDFPGHITCDADSTSELVVPIILGDRLVGVLDLDSPSVGRFDEADAEGCAALMAILAPRIAGG